MARLPEDKLQALQGLVHSWLPRKWCFRQELGSLTGHLHHAAKVVWPCKTFLRRMIDLLCCFWRKNHPIRLNNQFYLDLQWWHKFLSEWHGVSFWLFPGLSPEADIELSSDAAGSLGYGAFLRGLWFTGSWSPLQAQQSTAYKELFPVVVAAHIWGDMWCRRHVLFHSDNDAVVHILNSRRPKSLALCIYCAIFYCQLLDIVSPFLPSKYRGSTTRLLMDCLVFIGSVSGSWLPMRSGLLFKFPLSFRRS